MANFVDAEALRQKLFASVKDDLSPIALRYGYSELPLEVNIRWRPVVLILGNYSSGKSTLINELLGAEIQATGQAPTDDCFTVITHDPNNKHKTIKVTDQREGKVLLYDERFPFENMKRHGERFASHFRLLSVNSPFLEHLSIIDTPGMLDSNSRGDRGYDYQQVIGDLAQIADLILIMFDSHKAGTIRETHISLQDTLPIKTFEDRIIFVLNRVDECSNLNDLLRVYGTLCWNLSQMTQRKDIPPIQITYSEALAQKPQNPAMGNILQMLKNQREELKQRILLAPRYRLDHLTSFVEMHGERLTHMLEGLVSYAKKRMLFKIRYWLTGVAISLTAAALTWLLTVNSDLFRSAGEGAATITAAAIFMVCLALVIGLQQTFFTPRFHRQTINELEFLTPLNNQARKDSWTIIAPSVKQFLRTSRGVFTYHQVRNDYDTIRSLSNFATKDARRAIMEMDPPRTDI